MAHNPEVAGSNPAPTTKARGPLSNRGPLACSLCTAAYPSRAVAGFGRQSLTHPGEDGHAFGVLLRPAFAVPQPPEQQHHRQRQTTKTVDEERGEAIDVSDQPLEVLAEETGDERQRQENRGQDRELLDGAVLPDTDLRLLDRDHRQVSLQHGAEQVTLRGDILVG